MLLLCVAAVYHFSITRKVGTVKPNVSRGYGGRKFPRGRKVQNLETGSCLMSPPGHARTTLKGGTPGTIVTDITIIPCSHQVDESDNLATRSYQFGCLNGVVTFKRRHASFRPRRKAMSRRTREGMTVSEVRPRCFRPYFRP